MDAEEFSVEALEARLSSVHIKEASTAGAVGLKERFRCAMFFQEVDALPNFEFGYWAETLAEWRAQGMPSWVVDEETAYTFFGIENWAMLPAGVWLKGIMEQAVLEETDDYITTRDTLGVVSCINKHGHQSIPHYLEYPVKDRATWEPYKAGLNPEDPDRVESAKAAVKQLQNWPGPVGIPGGSLVGTARNLVGFENIAVLPYTDPELFQDIVDTFGHCICRVLEYTLPLMQVDFCMGWEDICFNQGPVVTPEMYGAVAGPWYRRIADLLVQHGCCVYTTDSDGNIMPIVDTLVSNGVNTMFPVEVHGGSDPALLRERYGRRIRLWGGVDKMALLKGRDAIDAELLRIKPFVEQGGFLPGVDHRVPADVTYDNYRYYLDRKRALFRTGGEPRY